MFNLYSRNLRQAREIVTQQHDNSIPVVAAGGVDFAVLAVLTVGVVKGVDVACLLYTSPSPRDS